MIRPTPLLTLALLLTALPAARLLADTDGNHLQMTFGGNVSVPTCRMVIPEKRVVMPSATLTDFMSLNPGDLFAEKKFSVSVADCTGGEAGMNQVVLYFDSRNNTYDDHYPAFTNEAGEAITPHASGLGAIITDERDDQNVTGSDLKPRPIIYDTATWPLGSEYHFIARYMKTQTTVTSGYFVADVIISATYQ